ncbi:MAG: helix-turn-helix transcriptional regulator [Candidatus Eisenbacteria bacterium]|nr:helix-turn-helix transcriptional regulator [Candidatus Eisenbacteria bacterium]
MPARNRIEDLAHDVKKADLRSEVLRALGNPGRLRIVAYLSASGEKTVNEIAETLDMPQSAVSQQLGSLRLRGLLRARQEGGRRYYSLAMPEVNELLACLARCCRPGEKAL